MQERFGKITNQELETQFERPLASINRMHMYNVQGAYVTLFFHWFATAVPVLSCVSVCTVTTHCLYNIMYITVAMFGLPLSLSAMINPAGYMHLL